MRLPSRSRSVIVVEVVVIGIVGALLGLLVAGRVTSQIGPFDAGLAFQPSLSGDTTVEVPPLGQLQLDTHTGPVRLSVRVETLREDAARAIVADPEQLRSLGDDVQRDLRSGMVTLAWRTGLVTLVGAAVLGLLVFRQRWRRVAAATGAGAGALVLTAGISALTFDDDALAEPRYTGLLASAPTAVGDVRDIVQRFDAYQVQLGRIVSNVSELYSVTSRLPVFTAGDDTIRVLHVSDLHLNPAAFDIIRSVATQFQVDVVLDSGDITDVGTVPETRYVREISTIGVPYVYVRGNHDSVATQEAVAAQDGAVVLDGPEVVEVAGLRFLGQGDPRFAPNKITDDRAARDAELLSLGRSLARSVRTAFEPPDVVAVHHPAAGEPLYGVTPLVLSGHTHKREDVQEEGTLHIVQGSTGGAGLRALDDEEPTPVTLTVLYFDPDTRELQAYDDVTLGGLGLNEASISRTVVAEPEDGADDDGSPTPDPTGSP